MLDTELMAKVFELKDRLINCSEYKSVKEKEKIMEEKCATLLVEYAKLNEEYNEAVRFEKYGSDVASIQKKLYEKKLELDENQYVRDYKEAYKVMSNLLNEVQNGLFEGIMEGK